MKRTAPQSRATRAAAACSSGFTLMEIILALGILAVIFTVSYRCITQLIRAKQVIDDRRDIAMIANALLGRMTREMQLATTEERLLPPQDAQDQRYGKDVHLIGTAATLPNGLAGDSVTFVANDAGQYVPNGQTHTGAVQITYRVEKDPDQKDGKDSTYYFIRDETPVLKPVERAYSKMMTFPITRNLLSLQFRYYDGEKWVSEWEKEEQTLPTAIRFTVKLRSPLGEVQSYSTMVSLAGQ